MNLSARFFSDAFGWKPTLAFYFLSTLIFAVQFAFFLFDSPTADYMDASGYAFFFAACLSHAATVALLPLLVSLLLSVFRCHRAAAFSHVLLVTLLSLIIYIDHQVYALYRFHLNGIVLSMFFGKGGDEIFNFSPWLYLEIAVIIFLALAFISLLRLSLGFCLRHLTRRLFLLLASLLLVLTLFTHAFHAYAAFNNSLSVRLSARLLPYFFPTTANSLLLDLGFQQPQSPSLEQAHGDLLAYPINPIRSDSTTSPRYHVVLILIDSWNVRSFTPECMPNLHAYAQRNQLFTHHWSCSNGTRSGVFGIFFSVPPYYWESFEPNHVSPVLIDELLRQGYDFRNFPSAQQYDPPFGRVLFHRVPDVRVSTSGDNALQRDQRITDDFVRFFSAASSSKPTFSFLFYDLPHSFDLPSDSLYHFQPSWLYAKYTDLNNDSDPTPFWNLYRNTCFQVDRLLAHVFHAIDSSEQADNTIVIITGDHAQEFNENHKNFWGHNGNFSDAQIAVPLVCHLPGLPPTRYSHRTTHYDIVPTLMRDYLNVTNPVSDYSVGHVLTDTASRYWHIVGSELNYAFITPQGDIIEKNADGSVSVTDAHLNPIQDFRMDARQMNDALQTLNRFFR